MNTLAIILASLSVAVNVVVLFVLRKADSDLCAVATETLIVQAQVDSANWAINDLMLNKVSEALTRDDKPKKTAPKKTPVKKTAVKIPTKKAAGRPRKTA